MKKEIFQPKLISRKICVAEKFLHFHEIFFLFALLELKDFFEVHIFLSI